jgi:hypothetical protein
VRVRGPLGPHTTPPAADQDISKSVSGRALDPCPACDRRHAVDHDDHPPLFELAPAPELLETVNLVLANDNGRLDPADDDDQDQGQTV